MSIGDIISRSWRLYRLNFSTIIYYALMPAAIIMVGKVLMNLMYATTPNENMFMFSCLCCWPIGALFILGGIFISLVFNFGLIKTLFNLLTGEDSSISHIIAKIKNNIVNLMLFSGVMTLEIIAIAIVDMVLLTIFYFLLFIPMLPLGMLTEKVEGFEGFFCMIFFIYFIVLGTLLLSVLGLQFLFIVLQLVIYTTENSSMAYCLEKSLRIILRNPMRCIVFINCLIFLWYVLAIFFEYPIMLGAAGLSVGVGQVPEEYFPAIFFIFSAIWTNVINMFLWPFLVSSIHTFYYDIRIREEGFDLHSLLKAEVKNYSVETK